MGRLFAAAIVLAWLTVQPLAPCIAQVNEETHFRPAKAVSVSNVSIPLQSVANGTVVLALRISEEGEVASVQVRRDIPSETEEAVRAVKTWKFKPARFDGKAVSSRVTVAVTFNPAPPLAANIPLPPLIVRDDKGRLHSRFASPDVTYATFPTSPVYAVNYGTVILEASLDAAGKVQHTKVLRDMPPFTATSIQAIGDWKFTPATLKGKPVESKVVLVFCFRPPMSNWP